MKSTPISFNGSSFENVSGMIGVPIGWAIVDDLKKLQVTVKELPVHENSLDMLVQKRINGFVCLETVFDSYIKRNPTKYSDIPAHLGKTLLSDPITCLCKCQS